VSYISWYSFHIIYLNPPLRQWVTLAGTPFTSFTWTLHWVSELHYLVLLSHHLVEPSNESVSYISWYSFHIIYLNPPLSEWVTLAGTPYTSFTWTLHWVSELHKLVLLSHHLLEPSTESVSYISWYSFHIIYLNPPLRQWVTLAGTPFTSFIWTLHWVSELHKLVLLSHHLLEPFTEWVSYISWYSFHIIYLNPPLSEWVT
jgi:predicted secreted protein